MQKDEWEDQVKWRSKKRGEEKKRYQKMKREGNLGGLNACLKLPVSAHEAITF